MSGSALERPINNKQSHELTPFSLKCCHGISCPDGERTVLEVCDSLSVELFAELRFVTDP